MTRERSELAGATDYAGYSLEDIVSHMSDWKTTTDRTVSSLREHIESVRANSDRLDDPDVIERYLIFFVDLFERFSSDFARLVDELPKGVRRRHVTLVAQLYKRSEREEQDCLSFKKEFISRGLKDESLRHSLIDAIYRETRGLIIDYADLSNVEGRLEVFVRDPSETANEGDIGVVDVKPSWGGITINLNPIKKRLIGWFKRKLPHGSAQQRDPRE